VAANLGTCVIGDEKHRFIGGIGRQLAKLIFAQPDRSAATHFVRHETDHIGQAAFLAVGGPVLKVNEPNLSIMG
jgi:hypothetical protein